MNKTQDLSQVKVGDTVTRMIAGIIEQPLKVTDVTDTLIVCGLWDFERATGVEYDPELKWGSEFGTTGSYIIVKENSA